VTTFGERLLGAFDEFGHLCVGIDPHPYLLAQWGLDDSAEGLREFGLRVVDAVGGRAGIVKPQVAFFERHGSAGYAALERVLGAARASGLVVVADVKRGDLGTSVEAYAQAWLTPGSPLEVDAITVSAYQGVGSLAEPIRLAQQSGKGMFVLVATSNPESFDTQTAILQSGRRAGASVAAGILADVNESNSGRLGDIGVVVGATVDLRRYGLSGADFASTPILAPGFGHQGAGFDSIGRVYGAASPNVLVSSSRAILEAGPEAIASAISAQSLELAPVFAE
jgi:orotidine-5'-phosphate decarboxylase